MARLGPLAARRWKRRDRKKETERPTLAKPKPARMGHPTEKDKVKIFLATIWMSYPPRVKALPPASIYVVD